MWASSFHSSHSLGLRSLRVATVIMGTANLTVSILGGYLVLNVLRACDRRRVIIPISAVSLAAAVRIFAMVRTGVAQKATALTMVDNTAVVDSVIRLQRRLRYKSWLWWSRFAMVITVLQILGAIYLLFNVAKYISHDGTSSQCLVASNGGHWKQNLLLCFVLMVCCVPLVQCFAGADVLRWRSFYSTQDDVWKAHYQEVFDHGIREALCCLGRFKYLTASEEDEIYSVARLLGDLVSYRASGTGHLELLAGLALLQRHKESSNSHEELIEAPKEVIQDALTFHGFAEAAYTGPLLDFGRHTVFFSCAWLYRQGILTPWTRNRRPLLTGDNWWRGHAAAFLNYVNLHPEALRRGRVCQAKCEAAYFVLVLHHLRSIVIAVRGTETPEDLITDGLGRECCLTREDLDGLLNGNHVHPTLKQTVESSFPHYGHSGIVEAARDLYMQIEGNPGNIESGSIGFLSSLLGVGCECDGYSVRVVGHSLGGAIATLLGLRLYGQYPSLHVYAYGPLPCVDSVISEACSEFVTSIIHNNEFSARLSVGSVLRLQAAAIKSLAEDSKTDTASIFRLARQFLYVSEYQKGSSQLDPNHYLRDGSNTTGSVGDVDDGNFENPFHGEAIGADQLDDPVSQFLETVPEYGNESAMGPPELFLPGRIIHLVPQQENAGNSLWRGWRLLIGMHNYKAYLVNRERFKDIVVSPDMFTDHLPWRCRSAMQKVLETQDDKGMLDDLEIS